MTVFRISAGLMLLAVALASAADANLATWNRFRGPNGSGVAPAARPPVKIGTNNLSWKAPVPRGLSSPVLGKGKVFLTALENERLVTLAFDAQSGARSWRREAPIVPIETVHSLNSPATPTPCTDEDHVYVYFGSFGLICYSLEGEVAWQKPIPTPKNVYGMATSPILHRDLLILVLDSDANMPESKLSRSRIVGFKKATGETAWETARPLHRAGWSTPAVWHHETNDDLVVLGSGRLGGYDPDTGLDKWFVNGFARETTAVPVFGNGLAFASSAMGGMADEKPDLEPLWKAMLFFDTNGDGKIAQSEVNEYFTFPLRPEVPPTHPGFGIPLPSDPAARAARQKGIFSSIDKNRDGFWTHDEFVANLGPRPYKPWLAAVRPGGQGNVTDSHVSWESRRNVPEIPSPIYYQNRLYLVRNGGILTSLDASSGKVVFDERLGAAGQYTASPVLANDHLYLLSNKGVITVVATTDRFDLVHQHDLGESAFVTPAIDGAAIYVRTESHLFAFRAGGPLASKRMP